MDKIELYYQLANNFLREQDQRHRAIELKATSALGIGSTLVAIAALVIKDFSGVSPSNLPIESVMLAAGLGISFLFTAICVMIALWPRSWGRGMNPQELADNLAGYQDNGLIEWVADSLTMAFNQNENRVNKKAIATTWAMISLIGEVIFLGILTISTRISIIPLI